MWNNKKVSVIFPAYNEEKNIKNAINDFFNTNLVDEIIVVNNNSSDNTFDLAKETKAIVVTETKQGYGFALRRGLYEASGDLLITAEPDGTFEADDIRKLLLYSEEFDVVFGTRTAKGLIWDNAKMDGFLRYGNVAVAKLLEYIHNGPCLTDVGCTLKIIRRDAYQKIKSLIRVGGSHFSPEFMVICIRSHLKCVEIPVNYKERIGESKITSNFWKSFKLGLVMISLIIKYRFRKFR